jgi:cytochrome b pre-mRNA-processing protein 3
MILNKLRRRRAEGTIGAVYGAIVAQARHPAFYRDYGVPDTTTGRFEMIVVHLALVLRRLVGAPGGTGPLGQGVFDAFCRDMDGNLREMGVGDLAVPKEMWRMAEAFYGRAAAYDRALDMGDATALAQALGRNVFDLPGLSAEPALSPLVLSPQVWRLARYVQEAATGAVSQHAPPAFPDPGSIATTALRTQGGAP